ncbi:MAG: alpha/beta fold hydrolase, partial [Gemmatimonadota bacterium]
MSRRRGGWDAGGSAGATGDALLVAGRRLLALGAVEPAFRFLSVRGLRLHYLEVGEGSPVALIQGAGGGAANWYRLLGPLSRRFRV